MIGSFARVSVAAAMLVLGVSLGSSSKGRVIARLVSTSLLYVFIPLIILYKVIYTPVNVIAAYAAIVTLVFSLVIGSATALIPRLLRDYPRESIGASILAAGIHNSGFLPIPLMLILFHDAGPAALYATFVSSYASVITPVIVGMYGSRGGASYASVLGAMIRYPPFIALLTGLALRTIWAPMNSSAVLRSLYVLSSDATLLSFYLVGAALRQSGLGLNKAIGVIAVWRLGLEPVLTLAAIAVLGGELAPLWRKGLIIESMMPPATMNIVVSMIYGLDYKLVARAIGLITPISIALSILVSAPS